MIDIIAVVIDMPAVNGIGGTRRSLNAHVSRYRAAIGGRAHGYRSSKGGSDPAAQDD